MKICDRNFGVGGDGVSSTIFFVWSGIVDVSHQDYVANVPFRGVGDLRFTSCGRNGLLYADFQLRWLGAGDVRERH